MARLGQFKIRSMLIATAVISVAIAFYMSNHTEVTSQISIVGFFGPGSLDFNSAHDALLREIDRKKYFAIEVPKWATKPDWDRHSTARSDWFEITKNGSKNFVHISSSENGFTVDVWIYKRKMNHQTMTGERLLLNEHAPDLSNWWDSWLMKNHPDVK